MTQIVEVAWARDAEHLTDIAENIVDLVGYTAEEILAEGASLILPEISRTEMIARLATGEPEKIMARTFAVTLQCRDGGERPCEILVISSYDGEGRFTGAFGAIRCRPMEAEFAQVEAWWTDGLCDRARRIVHSLAGILI